LNKYGVTNISLHHESNMKKSRTLLNNSKSENEIYLRWKLQTQSSWKKKTAEELKHIYNKRCITIKSKYGDDFSPIKQMIKSIRRKYNVDNISQLPHISDKIKKTWTQKTNTEIDEINNKRYATMMDKYGYRHIMHDNIKKRTVINKSRITKQKKWIMA